VPTLKILFSLSTTLTRNKLACLSPAASRMFSSGCLNYLRRPLVHEFSTNCAMVKHASLFRPPFLTKKKKLIILTSADDRWSGEIVFHHVNTFEFDCFSILKKLTNNNIFFGAKQPTFRSNLARKYIYTTDF
jgi:hypothetical protein